MISKFIFIAGLLVCLAIAGVAQDEAKASARNEVDEGVQAFRQAHYDDAIAHFEQAVAYDPDLVVARMYLAATYLQVFQPGVDTPENVVLATRALEQYSEVLRSNPSDVESLKGLAYLKLQLNEFDEAKQAYAKAIALNPADPELVICGGGGKLVECERRHYGGEGKAGCGDGIFIDSVRGLSRCTDAISAGHR